VSDSNRHFDLWDAVRILPERSFGGSEVAVRPDDWPPNSFWPVGPSAPGADEMLEWLSRSLTSASEPILAFLVGGPGNGKSYLTGRFVSDLQEISPRPSGLAYRDYSYSTSGLELVLINDATIRPEAQPSSGGPPLIGDVNRCLEMGRHLLANVNRGILYEELTACSQNSIGRDVIAWLTGNNFPLADAVEIRDPVDYGYIRACQLANASGDLARVVVANMDSCSLFESRPSGTFEYGSQSRPSQSSDAYRIQRLRARNVDHSNSTSASRVISELVQRIDLSTGVEEFTLNPIADNISDLSSPRIRANFCTLLRSSELITARRMTYRELWGAVSLALVGSLPETSPGLDAYEWTHGHQPSNQSDASDPLELLIELASVRFHQAIFRPVPFRLGGVTTRISASPVTQMTALVDPVRDARPGRWGSGSNGWADPVIEAFAGQDIDQSPLEGLLDSVNSDDPVHEVIGNVEVHLDKAFVEARLQRRLNDSVMRRLTSWYGQFLLRMYAVSNGIPAFSNELDMWTRVWIGANNEGAAIPQEARSALSTLLLPPSNPDSRASRFIVPIFDARTIPISDRADDPKLVISMPSSDWDLEFRNEGDQLFLNLTEGGHRVVEIEVDFAVIREAMSCAEDHVGITELTHIASPRLERFRAALLRSGRRHNAQPAVLDGTRLSEISIEVGQ